MELISKDFITTIMINLGTFYIPTLDDDVFLGFFGEIN